MRAVRGKHTGPELIVRRAAHSLGLRFRLFRNDLPGKPDLTFPRFRTVLFVNGCFWHQHIGCPKSRMPKSNLRFWRDSRQDSNQSPTRVSSPNYGRPLDSNLSPTARLQKVRKRIFRGQRLSAVKRRHPRSVCSQRLFPAPKIGRSRAKTGENLETYSENGMRGGPGRTRTCNQTVMSA